MSTQVADLRADQLLTRSEVEALLKCSRSSVYELIRRAGFPKPIKVGPRQNRWLRTEISEWLAQQPRAHIKSEVKIEEPGLDPAA